MRALTYTIVLAWSLPAFAVPDPSAPVDPVDPVVPEPAPPVEPDPVAPEPLPTDEILERLEELERTQRENERAQRHAASTHQQVQELLPLRRFITVFVDVGGFAVGGDGSGIRSDRAHVYYPEYADHIAGEWVFMGDPLSTAINSLGEPATTGSSREVRNDTVKSDGKPSLIVNSVGLSIGKEVGRGVAVGALVQLLPRPGRDVLAIELAHVDYRPSDAVDLILSVGKIDSVLGVEYRSQDAPRRLGVTPSLLCRYTCGRPVGIQARLVRGRLSTSASIANGDTFEQRFEQDLTLKANVLPTVSGHVQWMLPLGQGLEVGVSGALGPQDGQSDASITQWHLGVDAHLRDLARFDVSAEYIQGVQQGSSTSAMIACNTAPCLRYKAAYLLVDRRVNTWFTPYVRVDWRDALHQDGVEFVYESHTLRATLGAHVEMTSRIIGKLEYTFNRELGRTPQFANDIITTSIVVATD